LIRRRIGFAARLVLGVVGRLVRRVPFDRVVDELNRALAVTSLSLSVKPDPFQLNGFALQPPPDEAVSLDQLLGVPADVFGVLGSSGLSCGHGVQVDFARVGDGHGWCGSRALSALCCGGGTDSGLGVSHIRQQKVTLRRDVVGCLRTEALGAPA
jgi:hypothetical protein